MIDLRVQVYINLCVSNDFEKLKNEPYEVFKIEIIQIVHSAVDKYNIRGYTDTLNELELHAIKHFINLSKRI
jgi:hypothetical protein